LSGTKHILNITKKRYLFSKGATVLFSLLLIPLIGNSQTDTTKKSMSFDFGITRDMNINLWPIFKRTTSNYEKDKQLLFPIYRSYHNFRNGERRTHILPIFWKDSSRRDENLRIISTYYPSLIHISKDKEEKTKTFTFLELAPRINLLEFKKSPDGLVMQNNLLLFLWYQNNQVTKKSHLIVFPAYWQFKSPIRESHTLFPIYSYGNNLHNKKQYSAITPLFWHLQSPKRSSNLFFPIYWNRKIFNGKDSTISNLVFPVYWSHRDRNTSNKVVFPIVWSLNNFRYKSLTILPLVSFGHNTDKERHHLMVTPLFWHVKRYEGESTTLFPIVWSSTWKTKYENYSSLVVFPVYWAQQSNNNRSQVLLPFVWSKITPYYRSFSFIPLFSVGQSPDKTSGHVIVTPLFWHYKSPDIISNTFFPIWWKRKRFYDDVAQTTNIVFPLYWERKEPSFQRNILFPLVWNFKNTEYHTFTFAPFISKGQSTDGKNSYLAVTPLYWSFKTEQGKGKLLFPLWWQNDRTNNGELSNSSRVVLLYWKYKDIERKHQGLLPLVWKLQNKSNQSFTFFPIISHGQSIDSSRNYLAITPLFWHLKNQERTFNTLFPIWWNRNINDGQYNRHFQLLIPVYFAKWDSLTSKKILFPIIWSLKNLNYKSFTFVPLFSYGQSTDENVKHLAITPLFWYFRNPDGYSASLIPIFWNSKYGEGESAVKWNVIFPIYWRNKGINQNNHVLFPIIWSFNNSLHRSFTIAPLFYIGHSNDNSKHYAVITPLFWHIKKPKSYTNTFLPIWWSSQKEVGNKKIKTDILFPIYLSFNNQHRATKVLFPLVWSFRSSNSHSFTFAPIFSTGQNINGKSHLMVTPLFWKFDSKAKHRRVLFPLFTSYSDTANHKQFDLLLLLVRHSSTPNFSNLSILWPIVEREKSIDYKYFRFAPLVWSKKSPAFNYFTIQPFFYHSLSKENETYRILWELFVHRNQSDVKKSNSILWKVTTWDKYNNGDHDFRLLYLLYANSNVNGKVEKSLFPFYYLTKDNKGNRSLSAFFYFYNSLKRKIPNTKEYYQEERIFWLIRIRSNYKILKQKGIEVE